MQFIIFLKVMMLTITIATKANLVCGKQIWFQTLPVFVLKLFTSEPTRVDATLLIDCSGTTIIGVINLTPISLNCIRQFAPQMPTIFGHTIVRSFQSCQSDNNSKQV